MMVQFSGTTLTATPSRQRVQLESGERSARAAPRGQLSSNQASPKGIGGQVRLAGPPRRFEDFE